MQASQNKPVAIEHHKRSDPDVADTNMAYDSASSVQEAPKPVPPKVALAAPVTPEAPLQLPLRLNKAAKKLSFSGQVEAATPSAAFVAPAVVSVTVPPAAEQPCVAREAAAPALPPAPAAAPTLEVLSPHKTPSARIARVFSKKKRQAYKELKTTVKAAIASQQA